MPHLVTTQGKKAADELEVILPHEHIYVDLKKWYEAGYAQTNLEEVITIMRPILQAAKTAGVTAIVECSPVGVGRRADIDKAVSDAADLPIVVPTGIYREPWIPDWAQEASEDALYEWMLKELTDQIDETGVQAGWIKLSAGDDGMTDCEAKILRAAARAGKVTGALIGSHTIRGRVVHDQLDIIEATGYTAGRFLWIHTQAEEDPSIQLEIARRGAWLEYDWIGGSWSLSDADYISHIQHIADAGFAHKLLLSHDQGWHDHRVDNIFLHIPTVFIPKLRAAGLGDLVPQLTIANPFNAFAR
jgi:phosphotriesterase-related protein